ncbi:MAG: DUF2800 domain-containing protein, partial [Thermoplasmata archaeon]
PAPPGEDRLAALVPWVPFMKKWLEGVLRAGERALLAGRRVGGQKLVHGRSARRWVREVPDDADPDGGTVEATDEVLVARLTEDFELDREGLFVRSLKTGPQVEKLVPRDRRKEFNERLLEKPEGRLTMVPEDDPKPAVTVDPDPGADFGS